MAKFQDKIISIFRGKTPLQKDASPFTSTSEQENVDSRNGEIENHEENGNNISSLESLEQQLHISNELQNPSLADSLPPMKQDVLAQLALRQLQNEDTASPGIVSQQLTQAHTIFNITNAKDIHLGPTYINNMNTIPQPVKNTPPSPSMNSLSRKSGSRIKYKRTPTIVAMMESDQEMEHRFIKVISEHMCKWKNVARELGFSEGQIEAFQLDNIAMGIKEVKYQMVYNWTTTNENPTLGFLTKILWRVDNREAVYFLKEEWKAMKEESKK